MILTQIFNKIMDLKGEFDVLDFRIGRAKTETSYAKLLVRGRDPGHLQDIMLELYRLGAVPSKVRDVEFQPAPSDRVLPDNFYSTTNHPTSVHMNGGWVMVEGLMMDKVVVVDPESNTAYCKAILDVRKGDLVVIGESGIKVEPPERPREGVGVFKFMGSGPSSEKATLSIARRLAKDILELKKGGGKIVVVAGPAVIHTGGDEALARLIHNGYVDFLLSGNALAVHDIEYALYGTSLGVKVSNGSLLLRGHRNHISAINEIYKAGSISSAIDKGIINSGIMYECITNEIPFVLAGSIRDDGPLPEVITDSTEAQKLHAEALDNAELVLMFATTLHSIAVGNMLPSNVRIVCVDINPNTITKLLDRGTTQAVGVVSDVGAFIPLLSSELQRLTLPTQD
ncbi:MAG: TIGR00300 family protein [Candidatus Bathyarchaeota archaeon]|nr:MAG: TIGR00300 family protein [Candidatus Bathyarchaeota archaeon]